MGLLLQGQVIGDVTMKVRPPKAFSCFSLPVDSSSMVFSLFFLLLLLLAEQQVLKAVVRGRPFVGEHPWTPPIDSEHRVNYKETCGGERIDVSEMFTAALESMLLAAPEPRASKGVVINGASASGGCSIDLRGLGTPPLPFSWPYAARTVSILFYGIMVQERLFRELDFDVEFRGEQVAKGFVFKLPPVQNNVTGTTAISRRQVSARSGL